MPIASAHAASRTASNGPMRRPAPAGRAQAEATIAPLSPAAEWLTSLQRTAGNRAVTGMLAAQRDREGRVPIASGPGERPIAAGAGSERRPVRTGGWEEPKSPGVAGVAHGGTEVDLVGVVDQDGTNPGKDTEGRPGLNLRPTPSTEREPLGRLADRDHVVAKRDLGDGWMYVVATHGHTWGGAQRGGALKGTAGFVKTDPALVNFDLPPGRENPDPGAFLYRIPGGQWAHKLVREVYGGGNIKTGQDQRFFTNVLKYLNDSTDRGTGIVPRTTTKRRGEFAWEEDDLHLVGGKQIWLPSLEMAQSLKGTVSRGSMLRDIAEKLKDWAKTAAAIPAFIAGLVVGAIESIRDFFVGLFDLVWNAIKTLGGSLVDAAKAIWDLVTDERKRAAAFESIEKVLDDLIGPNVSFLRKAYNWGRIVGYLTMEVVSALLLGGAVQAAKAGKWGARLAQFGKAVGELGPVKNVIGRARGIARSPAGLRIAELAAPVGTVVKKAGAAVDVVTGAPGRAVLKTAGTIAERAVALGSRYGWSSQKLATGARIMEKYGVKLYLRKSSKYAPMRMAEGAVAKPAVIKANTLNELDLMIAPGFTEKELGLVAHFEPLPKKDWRRPAGLSDDAWAAKLPDLERQATKRAKSYRKLNREMKRLGKPVPHGSGESYVVEGGLVKQVEQGAGGERIVRPLTSDIDVLTGATLDGSKLGSSTYKRLDTALLEAEFGEHGFHTEWIKRGDFDPDGYYGIIEQHLNDPVIEIGPDLIAREVKANEIPEVAEILNSRGYKRWRRSRTQKAVRSVIVLAGQAWASWTGAKSRR